MKFWRFFPCLLLIFGACSRPPSPDETPAVTVSILPQRYFVERIAGEEMNIHVLIPPGYSPATYEPLPQQMLNLSKSKIYFRIGHIPFEKAWIRNITSLNPQLIIVDTSAGVDLITGTHHHSQETSIGKHESPAAGVDPHIWLSPTAVKIQAKHILDTLIRTYPVETTRFQQNYRQFIQDIEHLDDEIKTALAPFKNRSFIAYHPAWSYFARDFHLNQIAVEKEGNEPGPGGLKEIIQTARSENIRTIVVQQQFDTQNAHVIADEIEGNVIQLDPLHPRWLENMRFICRQFIDIFKGSNQR